MAHDPELKAIADREASDLHESFVKWVKANTGYEADADSVALALRLHPKFRQSEDYEAAREAHRAVRAADADAAHARAQERLAQRIAAAEEKAAALKAQLSGKPAPKVRSAGRAAAKPKRSGKAATGKAAAKETGVADMSKARAARSRRGQTKPADDESDPF